MKKLYLALLMFFAINLYSEEKIDITKKPEPLEKIQFNFPDYEEFTLSNGLKVFLIEDHEQPVVTFRLNIPGGTSMDDGKFGLAQMVANLLEKGAGKRNALEIAKLLDGVGASFSANAGTDNIIASASSLKKHLNLLLEIYSEIIIKPTFDKDEFEKQIPQFLSSIQDDKSKGGQIAANLARKVIYGDSHPYSGKMTEKTVKELKIGDVKDYYKKYFIPNNSTLAIVGDVTKSEIKPLLEKAFKNWEKGKVTKIQIPEPKPQPLGVYYVNRPGSVQSSINITSKAIPMNHPDYEALDIASSIIGAGFAGRLFRTLRETYSYTYTPFGSVSSSKYTNRFQCGAEVRNSVTDSAISVTLEQLKLLTMEPPSDEELERIKKFEVGQYLMSFENSNFIASLIQNADFNEISLHSLRTYPERIMAISPSEIRRVAKEYMNPSKASIVVVGAPDIKNKLTAFGKIFEYDLDLNPLTGEKGKFDKVNLNYDELIEKYVKAIGGKENLSKIKSMEIEATADLSLQGRNFQGKLVQKFKSPNKMLMDLNMGIFQTNVWVDGVNAFTGGADGKTKQEGIEADKLLFTANLFKETKLKELGYKCDILGKQGEEIVMKAVGKSGHELTLYFDANKYLLNKIESIEIMPAGPTPVIESFSDYTLVDNLVLLPKTTTNSNPMFNVKFTNQYKFNIDIPDSDFEVKQ